LINGANFSTADASFPMYWMAEPDPIVQSKWIGFFKYLVDALARGHNLTVQVFFLPSGSRFDFGRVVEGHRNILSVQAFP
jgi:hypothetical protein